MRSQKKIQKESLVLGNILRSIAPSIAAKVLIEPAWNVVGQITFKNGKRSYWRYNTLDLNPVGSSDVAKDKDYASFFMQKMGYPVVPKSKTFYRDDWATAVGAEKRTKQYAYAYAEKIGFPVVVKPNSGSQGVGVAIVHTKTEFFRALADVFKNDRIALVQKPVRGKDYRLVVLDREVISAYERIPLSVLGDGKSSIRALLLKKQKAFVRARRDTRIRHDDPRIKAKLLRQGFALTSVPKKNEQIYLLDNANLSTGGDSRDVTGIVHKDFKKLAATLTKDMGLRLCGVDLMVDGDIAKKPIPGTYHILEINAAPGLDHYARSGKEQRTIVENLYRKILRQLEKRC